MCITCGFPTETNQLAIGRRAILSTWPFGAIAFLAGASAARGQSSQKLPPKPDNVLSPEGALARLKDGNKRYVQGVAKRHDFVVERETLAAGQNPYAAVLSCADSRVAPEYAFDSGRGDLFVVRVAGNFVNPDNIASFEYAVEVLKTPLLMVLGHDACGAVKSTIELIQNKTTLPGHLPSLVANLTPAVNAVANNPGDLLKNASEENVRRNVDALKGATPILSAALSENRIKVVGAMYRLRTGEVQLIT